MPKEFTLEQIYDRCTAEGSLILQDNIDLNKIRSMIEIARNDLNSARSLLKIKPVSFGSVYKLYYDVIHQLAEALILFDRIKSYNHQCLFSYLCVKHPELELDWNFFEKIRTKRNGINYYGRPIAERDWTEIKVQIELYVQTILKAIEEKIKND